MGQQAHFISLDIPLSRREGWDSKLISFRLTFPSQGERGMGRLSHFVSFVALRVTAFGRNP